MATGWLKLRASGSKTLPLALRLALAGAFFVAGALKLANPEHLSVTIRAVGLVPDSWAEPLAWLLPAAELGAAVLLALGRPGGLAGVTALLCLFVAVLAYARSMGLDIDCGCYGPQEPQRQAFASIKSALIRDAVMLAAAAYLYWNKYARSLSHRRHSGNNSSTV